jgi:hypothetical protein
VGNSIREGRVVAASLALYISPLAHTRSGAYGYLWIRNILALGFELLDWLIVPGGECEAFLFQGGGGGGGGPPQFFFCFWGGGINF